MYTKIHCGHDKTYLQVNDHGHLPHGQKAGKAKTNDDIKLLYIAKQLMTLISFLCMAIRARCHYVDGSRHMKELMMHVPPPPCRCHPRPPPPPPPTPPPPPPQSPLFVTDLF